MTHFLFRLQQMKAPIRAAFLSGAVQTVCCCSKAILCCPTCTHQTHNQTSTWRERKTYDCKMLFGCNPAARGNTAGIRTGQLTSSPINHAGRGNIRIWELVLTFEMFKNNEDNCHKGDFFIFHYVQFHKHCSPERSQHVPTTITIPSVFPKQS